MAGHSKWSNIKRRKGASDAKRSKIFSKLGKELTVAVKQGGGPDPSSNPRLANIIAKARSNNMPNDNIQRVIKKAAGDVDTVNYEEILYEGYGAGGVAFLVQTLTDNKNRTAGDVRHIFDKCGGSLGTSGCVAFMFDKKGIIIIEKQKGMDLDEVMMEIIDLGAEDIDADDDEVIEIVTNPDSLNDIKENLEKGGYKILSATIDLVPQNSVTPDENTKKKLERLVEMLDDNDDVQDVYHNAENLD